MTVFEAVALAGYRGVGLSLFVFGGLTMVGAAAAQAKNVWPNLYVEVVRRAGLFVLIYGAGLYCAALAPWGTP